MSNITMCSNTL